MPNDNNDVELTRLQIRVTGLEEYTAQLHTAFAEFKLALDTLPELFFDIDEVLAVEAPMETVSTDMLHEQPVQTDASSLGVDDAAEPPSLFDVQQATTKKIQELGQARRDEVIACAERFMSKGGRLSDMPEANYSDYLAALGALSDV